jgi:predicted secreted protein
MSNSPTVALSGAAFVFNTHGIITGVVRDSVTGLPIAGIEVSAYPAGQVEPDVLAGLMNTDSHGRYAFSLDAGDYAIGWMDEQQRYNPGFYNGGHLWPDATAVTVSTGATTTVNLSLKPKPHVTLTTPVTGFTWVAKLHRFTTYGYLKPRHTAGTYPVKIYCYRYQKGATGRYGWVLRKTASAKAYDYHPHSGATYTKYSVKLSLPYTGRWRIRAYHAPDSKYAPTYSAYRYVTVR